MGLGNNSMGSNSGNKGSNFNYEFRVLQLLDLIVNSTSSIPSGLATESTLTHLLATMNNLLAEQRLDFETRSIKDSAGNIYLMRISWDDSADSYVIDYIDGSGNVVVPVAPIQIYNTDGLLNSILTEIQKLTTQDIVTFSEDSVPGNAGSTPPGAKKISIQFYGSGGIFDGVVVEDGKVIDISNKTGIINGINYIVPTIPSLIDNSTRITLLIHL